MVRRYQVGDAHPVCGLYGIGNEVARRKVTQKLDLGCPSDASFEQVTDLGDDKLRDDQRTGVRFEQIEARIVIGVVFIDVGIERTGIDDQRDRLISRRMMSSI